MDTNGTDTDCDKIDDIDGLSNGITEAGLGPVKNSLFTPFSLVMVDFFGLGCILPLLPFFTNDYGGDKAGLWLGAILTCQSLGVVCGTIIIGILSDKFGRRQIGAVSMFADCLFFFLSGVVKTPELLLVVRLAAGLFCPIPVSYGWVIDISSPEERPKNIGKLSAAIMGGMFGGFVVAAFVGEYFSFFTVMCVPAALALLTGIATLFAKDPIVYGVAPGEKAPVKKRGNPKATISTWTYRCIFLIQFGVGLVVGQFTTISTLMMVNKHGMTPISMGAINILTVIVLMLSNIILFPFLFKHVGAQRGIPAGLLMASVLFTVAGFYEHNLWIYFGCVLPGFLVCVTALPAGTTLAASISKAVSPDAMATVQGITRAGNELGRMIAPIISTALYGNGEGTYYYSYLWVTIIMVITSLIWIAKAEPPPELAEKLAAQAEIDAEAKKEQEHAKKAQKAQKAMDNGEQTDSSPLVSV